jgi:hypothetical protein
MEEDIMDVLSKALEDVLSELEEQNVKAILDLKELQSLSQSLFETEAKRLAEKHGQDHPRVEIVEVKVSHSTQVAMHLKSLIHVDKARICISAAWQRELIVCGWITNLQGQGVEGLKVNAFDKDLKDDEFLASTMTDKDGIFLLCFDPESLPDPVEGRPKIYIEVIERSGEKLYTLCVLIVPTVRAIEVLGIRRGENSVDPQAK